MTKNDLVVDNPELRTMQFHGDEIVTFMKNGEPFVAMRRIVENLGVDWGSQFRKLHEQSAKFNCCDMTTVGDDGKQREMLCMPVSKLALWLATINPNKIKDDEKRAKIERYQEESAIALHQYWSTGVAVRGDLDGVVTDLDPKVMKAIGGMFKAIVHKEIAAVVPSLVEAEISSGHMSIVRGMSASQVMDMAGYPKDKRKGTRGVAQLVSNRLRRLHAERGVRMNMGTLGDTSRYLFDVGLVREWLADGGKRMIGNWISEKRGETQAQVFPLFS